MRLAAAVIVLLVSAFAPQSASALQKTPYPEVKVEAPPPFRHDPALDAMRKSLAAVVQRKDAKALFALVSPDFTWTADGDPPSNSIRSGTPCIISRSPSVFVPSARKKTAAARRHSGFCSRTRSLIPRSRRRTITRTSPAARSRRTSTRTRATAPNKHRGRRRGVEWVYTLKEIALTEKPTGGGTVAKVSNAALPVVSRYPAARPGETVTVSFYEVLLPSGKTGWIDADGVDPVGIDRFATARTRRARGRSRVTSRIAEAHSRPHPEETAKRSSRRTGTRAQFLNALWKSRFGNGRKTCEIGL